MKLTKRSGVFYLDYRDPMGKRRRLSTGTSDRLEAEKAAGDLMAGRDSRSGAWTVKDALDHSMKAIWQHSKSWKNKLCLVGLITDELGHVSLGDLTYARLQDYATGLLKQNKSPATVNRRLAVIGKACAEAQKLGKIAAPPPLPKQLERNRRLRWLTDAEEGRLLAACSTLPEGEDERMRQVIGFLVDTGARLGELLKLRPAQLAVGAATFLDTKNGKDRSVPTTRRAEAAGREIARLSAHGLMWDRWQTHFRFAKVRKAGGLEDVTLHTLRHTCASRLVQGGIDLYRVKTWLGHSTVTVTERYAHLAPSSLNDMAAMLERELLHPSTGATPPSSEL